MTRRTTPLFVPAAVALGHVLGYALAHPDPASRAAALLGHGYLGPLAGLGLLGALAGLGITANERRLGRLVAPRFGVMAQAGVTGFWLVELVERALHGRIDALLAEPGVWWGLAVQGIVAGLFVALAQVAIVVGAALPPAPVMVRGYRSVSRNRATVNRPSRSVRLVDALLVTATRRRGPPLLTA